MSLPQELPAEFEHELVAELRDVITAPDQSTVGALAKLIERLSTEIGFLNGLAQSAEGTPPSDVSASEFWNMSSDEIAKLGEMLETIEIEDAAA